MFFSDRLAELFQRPIEVVFFIRLQSMAWIFSEDEPGHEGTGSRVSAEGSCGTEAQQKRQGQRGFQLGDELGRQFSGQITS